MAVNWLINGQRYILILTSLLFWIERNEEGAAYPSYIINDDKRKLQKINYWSQILSVSNHKHVQNIIVLYLEMCKIDNRPLKRFVTIGQHRNPLKVYKNLILSCLEAPNRKISHRLQGRHYKVITNLLNHLVSTEILSKFTKMWFSNV